MLSSYANGVTCNLLIYMNKVYHVNGYGSLYPDIRLKVQNLIQASNKAMRKEPKDPIELKLFNEIRKQTCCYPNTKMLQITVKEIKTLLGV